MKTITVDLKDLKNFIKLHENMSHDDMYQHQIQSHVKSYHKLINKAGLGFNNGKLVTK